MKKLTFVIALLLFIGSAAMAQKAKLKRANQEFEQLNYHEAIQLYLQVLDKTDVPEAKVKLAESYRKVGNMSEAEYWYGQIVHLPDAKPIYSLYYAQALQANGKCDLAKEWFAKYSQLARDEIRGQFLLTTCDKEEVDRLLSARKDFYEVKHLPFNTKYDDFGPTYFQNGLVFSSERGNTGPIKRIHEWTGYPFLDLYFTGIDTLDVENFEFDYSEKPDKYTKKLNTKYHDGPICFSTDQKKIFFTRNNIDSRNRVGKDDEGVIRLKVFLADYEDGKWKNLQGLPFNSDEYSVAHPSLSPDGETLYFSSDMPGGFGGMDLYYSVLEDGQWAPPRNMGPRVNTEGHEVFPYLQPTSGRLYFSSDGQVGLGMLDIFYMDNNEGVWGPVMNIGYPINTTADDFGLILNDEESFGYFTSNREGGVGRDDIYSFKYSAAKIEVLVYDKYTGEPIEGATVADDCSKLELLTGANGKVTFEMPLNTCCTFLATKEPYDDNTGDTCTHNFKSGQKVVVKIPMERPLEFSIEGYVYDKESGLPLPAAKVTLTPDCGGEPIVASTDDEGKYSFPLDKECCYHLKAEYPDYLAVSTEKPYCTKGLGESTTFRHDFYLNKFIARPEKTDSSLVVNRPPGLPENPNGNTNPGGTVNGGGNTVTNPCDGEPVRFVLEHIYYDFDKAYIRSDAEEPLAELIKILEDNPQLVVEIGSHTDARGSNRYNDRLSRRRAKSVVRYLKNKGIASNRLEYQGYGEKQPTNECVNRVPCDEEKHQRNRRTEFRVVGLLDGTRFDCDTVNINQSSVAPIVLKKVDRCGDCPF